MSVYAVSIATLLDGFNARCLWCGREVTQQGTGTLQPATREHLIPRESGGGNGVDNLALACKQCNHLRHTSPGWPPTCRGPTDALLALSDGHRWAWGRLLGQHRDHAPWYGTTR